MPQLNGEMEYQKRTHSYMILLEKLNHPILLIPNSKSITIGDKKHQLSHPTLLYWSRLYMPLAPFLKTIGYESSVQKKRDLYL